MGSVTLLSPERARAVRRGMELLATLEAKADAHDERRVTVMMPLYEAEMIPWRLRGKRAKLAQLLARLCGDTSLGDSSLGTATWE